MTPKPIHVSITSAIYRLIRPDHNDPETGTFEVLRLVAETSFEEGHDDILKAIRALTQRHQLYFFASVNSRARSATLVAARENIEAQKNIKRKRR